MKPDLNPLIIGSNSKLVSKILDLIPTVSSISHSEIATVDFSRFSRVYLFSYDRTSYVNNVILIDQIPAEKLVYISTTAVYSLLVRKQWNTYPNLKSSLEKYVLCRGGAILRIGVTDSKVVSKSIATIPYTSIEKIASTIVSGFPKCGTVLTPIHIVNGGLKAPKSTIVNSIYKIALILPSHIVFQAPLELFVKKFLSASYGYTADSSRCFCNKLMIGYGAIGSRISNSIKPDLIITSVKPDELLCTNGFRDSRIGYLGNGLSKFWHGVSIINRNGKLYKNVPFFLSRKSPPPRSIKSHVKSVSLGDVSKITLVDDRIIAPEIYARNIHLAAGSIGNIRLLSNYIAKPVFLSDHEIGIIGTVDTEEIIKLRFLRSFLFFVYGRQVLGFDSVYNILIDFRPVNPQKIGSINSNIYNERSYNLVKKLIKKFSFAQINEAIHNKLGFSIKSSKMAISLQILNKDCISYDGKILTRMRLSKIDLETVSKHIAFKFETYKSVLNPTFFDGQHYVGASELLNNPVINDCINNKTLHIYGSPTRFKLDNCHHTLRLIDAYKETL